MITVNSFSAFDFQQTHEKYITLPFFQGGRPVEDTVNGKKAPACIMSLATAGSLRYNSGKENPSRQIFLQSVLPPTVIPVPVYLIHSKRVFIAEKDVAFPSGVSLVSTESGGPEDNAGEARADTPGQRERFPVGAEGDGIITLCPSLAPCVTAADCMPIFLWDSATGAFGICHSGWKGTGIAARAVSLMEKEYGSKPEDICIVLGPHIHECCYTVDEERATYFRREFSPDCCTPVRGGSAVAKTSDMKLAKGGGSTGGASSTNQSEQKKGGLFHLSLARANIVSLVAAGIKPENILHCTDCTSCFSLSAASSADTADCVDIVDGADTMGSVDGVGCVGSSNKAQSVNSAGSATSPVAGTTAASNGARRFPYGSFRRQTSHLPEGTPLEERFKVFSAMLALVGYIPL